MALKVGDRVKFRPTHAKELELTGKIGRIHKDKKTVDVESEPGKGSVSRIYSTHVDDCTVVEEAETAQPSELSDPEKADNVTPISSGTE